MSILKEIIANKKIELEKRRSDFSLYMLKSEVQRLGSDSPSFINAIQGNNIKIIAEIKKTSPSKGDINTDVDILEVAKIYEDSGASAISVLTDYKYFKGKLEYLKDVASMVSIPCLCKDFIIDEYQIYEAKLNLASAFLIIVKALGKDKIAEFIKLGKQLKLDALVEVHDTEDLKKIEDLSFDIIGINNRNLDDFSIDINRSVELKSQIEKDVVTVSESGIYSRDDILLMQNTGFDAVLVGSSIMGSGNIKNKLKELGRFN